MYAEVFDNPLSFDDLETNMTKVGTFGGEMDKTDTLFWGGQREKQGSFPFGRTPLFWLVPFPKQPRRGQQHCPVFAFISAVILDTKPQQRHKNFQRCHAAGVTLQL